MRRLQLFVVLISVLVFVPLCIQCVCPGPQEAAQQITTCLSQFNSLMDFTKGTINTVAIVNYCNSSARTTEIQCAEEIITECKQTSSKTQEVIDKTVNINAFRSSVNVLCNSIDILEEKHVCINRYQSSVTTCLVSESIQYNSNIQTLKTQGSVRGSEWLTKKVYEELCRYFGKVVDCQRPYGRNCGRKTGDLFDALAAAVTPPVCTDVPISPPPPTTTTSTSQPFTPNGSTQGPFNNSGVVPKANIVLLLAFVAFVKTRL